MKTTTVGIVGIVGEIASSNYSFHVPIRGWNNGKQLSCLDHRVSEELSLEQLAPLSVCDAVIVAVQKSKESQVQKHLRKDAPNIFFSSKHKRLFVLRWNEKKETWLRKMHRSLSEFIDVEVRFFSPA